MSKSSTFFKKRFSVSKRRSTVRRRIVGESNTFTLPTRENACEGALFDGATAPFHERAPYLQQLGATEEISPRVKELLAKRPSPASLAKHTQTLSAFRTAVKKILRRRGAFLIAGGIGCLLWTFGFPFSLTIAISSGKALVAFLVFIRFIGVLFIVTSLVSVIYGVLFILASFSEEKTNRLLDEYDNDPLVVWALRKARVPFGAGFNEKHLRDFERRSLDNEDLYCLSLLPSAGAYLVGIRKPSGSGLLTRFDVEALKLLAEEDVKRGASRLAPSSV